LFTAIFLFHRCSSLIELSECSALSSEQPNANFQNPDVLESRPTSTFRNFWKK